MLKTISKDIRICDICLANGIEKEALAIAQPGLQDLCAEHAIENTQELRLPEEFGGEMSGFKSIVSPGHTARLKVVYKAK